MNMKPEIAIITPTFHDNRLSYLQQSIASILKQDFTKFIILIIDDNPNRSNQERLIDITKVDERIKYIPLEKNLWIAWARNIWINYMRQYLPSVQSVALVDDDDGYLLSNKLTEQYKFLTRDTNLWVVWTNWVNIDSENTIIVWRKYPETNKKIRNRINLYFPFLPSSMLFRRAIFDTLSFNESFYWSDDYDLMYKILNKYTWYTIQEEMTWYRIHENNTSFNRENLIKLYEEKISIISENGKEFGNYKLFLLFLKILKKMWPDVKLLLKKIPRI